jgi:ABC-2 type transport system permease protein
MNLRGWSKLLLTEVRLFFREWITLFFTFLFLPLNIFFFGSIWGNEPVPQFGGVGTIDYAVPGYTAVLIATTALFTIGIGMANYRERRVLRRLRATPLRPTTIIAAQLVVAYGMTLVGSFLMIVLARLVYDLGFWGNPLSLFLAFTYGSLSFFAIGFLLASLAPTARVAQAAAMMLFFPMMFVSGASVPLPLMPDTMQKIAKGMPLYYVSELLRNLWMGKKWGDNGLNLIVLAGLLIVGVVLSVRFFRWE